jgi:6-phosphogluconolactonase
MQQMRLEIASDISDLADQAVRLFASAAKEAVAARGVFRTAFSGGRTPERFFQRLAGQTQAKSLPWDKVHVFWVDERYVPLDSPASNYRLAAETLLSRIDIPQANVHRIPTEHRDIAAAALAYERTMREVFGLPEGEVPQFDLIVLGMGSDGHTASLFPNSQAVGDMSHLACAVRAAGDPKLDRITLTPRVLRAARRLAVLVSGVEKTQILKEVLTGTPDEMRYPIQVLWPVLDRVTWLVDREAAGEIGEA